MQTQTSNTLHNAVMEAGSKDRPPMLAPGNYIQWKSRIKRYIDTKPNHELIHHCLKNPSYKFTWADMEIPISEGSPVTRIESQMETYKTVLQDIRDQLNAEAEVVQIILTGIDNDIYSTVNACLNACEMWKAIERLKQGECSVLTSTTTRMAKHQNEVNEIRAERIARVANPLALIAQQQPVYNPQTHPTHYTHNSSTRSQQAVTRNRGKTTVNSPQPIYDQEPSMVAEDDETSKDKEIDKLMALISLSSAGYENQRTGNVAGARETVGSTVVQKYRIQCYNCKEFGHVARECQKPKRVKDTAYHREKMLLCKQEEDGIQLNAEQADWRDDTDDDKLEDQELEAHYMYMAQFQEVSPDAADSGPIFDAEPLQTQDVEFQGEINGMAPKIKRDGIVVPYFVIKGINEDCLVDGVAIACEEIDNPLIIVSYTKDFALSPYEKERFDTSAGNPVNEILLKLNLSDHSQSSRIQRIIKYGGEERFDTSTGNPVNEILLKLNLPDHSQSSRIQRIIKYGGEGT
nr:ribonuclease H-like domain-containing protein [Tanacetum cinerariifolium]